MHPTDRTHMKYGLYISAGLEKMSKGSNHKDHTENVFTDKRHIKLEFHSKNSYVLLCTYSEVGYVFGCSLCLAVDINCSYM